MEEVRAKLQEKLGSSPKVEVSAFTNWGGTQRRSQILAVSPANTEEVKAVIRAARALGLRVRAAGKTHSWTALFSDEGEVVLHTGNLKRPGPQIELLQDPDDAEKRLVTMAPNVTTGEFKEFQIENDISFPTNVIAHDITMGGVIVAGCHGAGRTEQPICDYVVSMRIIDSDGEEREYNIKDDVDMMRAVQCSLGLWGIVVEFTLKVFPLVAVETENRWVKVKDLFYDNAYLKDLIANNWSVEFLWFPFNSISKWEAFEAFLQHDIDCGEWEPKEDEVLVRIVNKTSEAHRDNEKYYKQLNFKSWINSKGGAVVDDVVVSAPQMAPSFLRAQNKEYKEMYSDTLCQRLPHAIHFLYHVQSMPVYNVEWAFSLDKECVGLMKATQGVVELIYQEALAGHFPVNLPFEMRVISDSEAYMTPAIGANSKYGGAGQTCFVEVVTLKGTPRWNDFSMKLAKIWSELPEARPHWAKSSGFTEEQDIEFLKKAYKKQIPKFVNALERSNADPDGMFFNQHLESVFYPEGHPGRADKPVVARGNDKTKGNNQLLGLLKCFCLS